MVTLVSKGTWIFEWEAQSWESKGPTSEVKGDMVLLGKRTEAVKHVLERTA